MKGFRKRDSYFFRGVSIMVGVILIYVTLDDPHPVLTGQFLIVLVSGGIIAIGSPKRWSVRTSLWLYRGLPLLVGISSVVAGGYYLYVVGRWVWAAIFIGLGIISMGVIVIVPWEEVETYLEYVKNPENDVGEAPAPIPLRIFLPLRYAGVGVVSVSVAVLTYRSILKPDFGHFAVLAGVGAAGLINIRCSPYSGSPEQVIKRRQLRWTVLGLGTGASSLYGLLLTDAHVPAAFWGAVTLGIGYWAFIRTDWDEVRETVAAKQADAHSDWE